MGMLQRNNHGIFKKHSKSVKIEGLKTMRTLEILKTLKRFYKLKRLKRLDMKDEMRWEVWVSFGNLL